MMKPIQSFFDSTACWIDSEVLSAAVFRNAGAVWHQQRGLLSGSWICSYGTKALRAVPRSLQARGTPPPEAILHELRTAFAHHFCLALPPIESCVPCWRIAGPVLRRLRPATRPVSFSLSLDSSRRISAAGSTARNGERGNPTDLFLYAAERMQAQPCIPL